MRHINGLERVRSGLSFIYFPQHLNLKIPPPPTIYICVCATTRVCTESPIYLCVMEGQMTQARWKRSRYSVSSLGKTVARVKIAQPGNQSLCSPGRCSISRLDLRMEDERPATNTDVGSFDTSVPLDLGRNPPYLKSSLIQLNMDLL